jgi:hypothetical protein
MLPPKLRLPRDEQRLLKLFGKLSSNDREQLLSFAEFLVYRSQSGSALDESASPEVAKTPLDIPRPASESVIAAIRRLTKSFPMLDKDALLHETSALMTAHVMQGRAAADVIDELEVIFHRHYERQVSANE